MSMRQRPNNGSNKGIHCKKQSIVHLPKGLGGLGVHCVQALNKAFLMTQVWCLYNNPQLLYSQVYQDKSQFAIHSDTLLPLKNSSHSWAMRGLRKMDHFLFQAGAWKVGTGQTLKAIQHKWVNGRLPQVASSVTLNGVC